MYPLLRIGPLNLSSGGLLLLIAIFFGTMVLERVARKRGGTALAEQANRSVYAAILGAIIGGRLWYGLFNWDVYSRTPNMFFVLRISEFAWPG